MMTLVTTIFMDIHIKRTKDDALEIIAQLVPTIAAAASDTNS